MTLEVDLFDETSQLKEEIIHLLNDTLAHAYKQMDIKEDCECSVTFVDNEKIQEINAEYRDKNQPTDVISFALEEGEETPGLPEDAPRMLGDIIISVPKAVEQAKEYGHSLERELGFLAIHGFLHLLGYDHMTPDDERDVYTAGIAFAVIWFKEV